MKKLAKLSPGRIFNFAGEKFVVMEQRDGATFVLLAQSKESCPFNDKKDAKNWNNYSGSTLQERIDKWVSNLPRNRKESDAILPFKVDLSCTDQSDNYGVLEVRAAPLTLWQYGKYKDMIPLDDEFWLATPWTGQCIYSQNSRNTRYVWIVLKDGSCCGTFSDYSFGTRPALLLNSDLLVSLDDEVEDDSCDECDTCTCGKTVDLSGV